MYFYLLAIKTIIYLFIFYLNTMYSQNPLYGHPLKGVCRNSAKLGNYKMPVKLET